MIKKIHYCWFGGNPLPDDTMKYMESWKKFCPDYEIICWDENNYDVNSCSFTEQAYKSKKWAFISDYARADILHKEGGLFLDTDVELLKNMENLMDTSFIGFESKNYVNAGLVLYAKNRQEEFFKLLMEKYKKIDFDVNNLSNITSPIIYTNLLKRYGLKCNNTKQTVCGLTVYPTEYFQPIIGDFAVGKKKITDNTYSIHHYSATWLNESDKKLMNMLKKYGVFWGRLFFYLIHPIKAMKRIKEKRRSYDN